MQVATLGGREESAQLVLRLVVNLTSEYSKFYYLTSETELKQGHFLSIIKAIPYIDELCVKKQVQTLTNQRILDNEIPKMLTASH